MSLNLFWPYFLLMVGWYSGQMSIRIFGCRGETNLADLAASHRLASAGYAGAVELVAQVQRRDDTESLPENRAALQR